MEGVPADMPDRARLKAMYEEAKPRLQELEGKKLVVVMLGGDVGSAAKGDVVHCRFEDNQPVLDHVIGTYPDHHVVVLNGPRTGKHDAAGVEITTVHRGGNMDRVTQDARDYLKSKGVSFSVFDFQFQQDGPPDSLYKPILGLVCARVDAGHGGDVVMFFPGESDSMLTDVRLLGLQKI